MQGAAGFCMGAGSGSMIVGMGFRSDGCGGDDDDDGGGGGSSAGFESPSGMWLSRGPSNGSGGGSDVLGDGGGRTKDVGRIDFVRADGLLFVCCFDAGTRMGITSVSYAGSTLVGDGMEKMEERRETRVLRLLPDLPTTFCLRGDLRGDFVTSGR